MNDLFLSRARPATGAVLLFGALVLASCQKPEDGLGVDVLDPADALGTNVTDTTGIVAWSVVPEPVRTSGLSRNVLGTYLDPDFGLVTAGIATQLRLEANNAGAGSTPSNLVCDSLVLSLAYDATTFGYGTTDPQGFRVFRLSESLSVDSPYTTDRVPGIELQDLVAAGRPTFTVAPYTRPFIDGDSLSPQLRIPLSLDLGRQLLDLWGSTTLANSEAFQAWFKGLLILPAEPAMSPFQQAALYINLLNADSKVRIYYRDVVAQDTATFDFTINSSCARYTVASFDAQRATQPGLPLALQDSTTMVPQLYVQALGGVRTELRFPHLLDHVASNNGAVAKAELVIPVSPDHSPLYQPPSVLFVFRRNADGEEVVLPDQILAASQIGGNYDATNHEYRFVITRWLQGVLNGEYPNTGLTVVPGSNGVTVNRAILNGPQHPALPMRLRLTFTTY
ncbi:MAG: DUF4270 family protein [Flavobacteriales bacterium]|nr:DUF4270 family protein [Flavobacteriales bacterium]